MPRLSERMGAFAGLQRPDSSLDGSQNFRAFLVLSTAQFVIENIPELPLFVFGQFR